MIRVCVMVVLATVTSGAGCNRPAPVIEPAREPPPPPDKIFDVHLHAFKRWPAEAPWYPKDFAFPTSDDALRDATLAALDKHHIVKAMLSGPADDVAAWRAKDPSRFLPGRLLDTEASIDELRQAVGSGALAVFGESVFQYEGLRADDPKIEPYLALAEELDVPVAWHFGPGPPGVPMDGTYTVDAGNPIHLEAVLKKHPKLRLYVMHAGWPFVDEMIGMLVMYPQLMVDIGVIDWYLPREHFHAYLKKLVDAGLSDRIMWGSDQMMWPDAIGKAIDYVQTAEFLTADQRRAIFYDNAARFFRIAR